MLNEAMCGRFTLTASPDEIASLFGLATIEAFPPRYNIAPTQPILIVIGGSDERPAAPRPGRMTMLVRWGLLPGWLKDAKGFPLLFNARSETAAEKNAFRAALRHRRCLVPATGFYEWRRSGSAKAEPYLLQPADHRPFAFAGLQETWLAPDGSEIDTAAIMTKSASGAIAAIHERMPVVIPQEAYDGWLNCRDNEPAEALALTRLVEGDFFRAVRISERVNAVANTGPDIQTPLPERERGEAPDSEAARPPADAEQFRLL
ncbi:SOS response-associated peptidase [Jiella sp. M17.18]|uniref:SOS response-associated peptidase n=1 Tax=Jiella sp. M17.18 TaxID=3234247 RepID=UPI0034E04DFA